MFRIQMASEFSGIHMGLVFAGGVAHSDDSFLATRLQSKGYNVTAEAAADDPEVHKQVEKSKGKEKGKKEKAAADSEPEAAPEPAPVEPSELPPTDDEVDE